MRSIVISICLYACESWAVTAVSEKRKTQANEMRCYRALFNISFKDHVTNEEVCKKSKQPLQMMNSRPSSDSLATSHGLLIWLRQCYRAQRQEKEEADRRRGGKTVSKNGQGWTLSTQLGQLKTGRV